MRIATTPYFVLGVFLLTIFSNLAFALPSVTFQPPTLSDGATTSSNWVYITITSSENLNQAMLEWGNSSGFTNVTMSNSSLTNWYINMAGLTDGSYTYSIWAQNTTGSWSQSARRFVYVDTLAPYSLYFCQDLTIENGSYVLAQNVSSAGTCFMINANNVTLDGAGYTVIYSQGSSWSPGIKNIGYHFTTIKNANILQGKDGSYAIYFLGAQNGTIQNNTITTSSESSRGIYLTASSNSKLTNNNITTSGTWGFGIMLESSSNSNIVSNNIITTSGTGSYAIWLYSSSSNTLLNNEITTSGIDGIGVYIYSSSSNSITDGSIVTQQSLAYYLWGADTTNNFTNTNFTALRKIGFNDATSQFNYRNNNTNNIWLMTNVSAVANITRILVNWNNTLIRWKDINPIDGVTANYIITGLQATSRYRIYNTSNGVEENPYNLTTDTSGKLPSFKIALIGNTEIRVTSLNDSTAPNCQEFWSYSGWSVCIDGTQTRIAIELNSCGTTVNQSVLSRSCSNNCSESWNYSNWSACVNGLQNRTATDVNNCGTTANISSVNRTCSQNDDSDGGGNDNDKGSGGGGSGESGKGTTTVIVNNVIVNNVVAVLVYNTDESSDDIVTRINVSLTADVSAPKIVINNMSIAPVSAPSKSVYQYLNITKSNFNNSNIDNAFIDFKVSKKWISANNITRVYLAHYDNGWTNLNTELINSTITHVMYRAHTKGFSYFAVVGENAQKAQASEVPAEQQLSKPQTASNTPSNTTSYEYVIPAIILLIAVYAAIKWLEKRNNGNREHTSIHYENKNPETKAPAKSEEAPKQQIQEKSSKIVKNTGLDNAQEELEDIKKKLDK